MKYIIKHKETGTYCTQIIGFQQDRAIPMISDRKEIASEYNTWEEANSRVCKFLNPSHWEVEPLEQAESKPAKFLIGQRVIIHGNEIGIVVDPESGLATSDNEVWVRSPTKGFASCYAVNNVRPLPNGQL